MSASLRNAALMLHGVSETDRAWILARLPESTKRELEGLVAELQTLGFASDVWPGLAAPAHDEAPTVAAVKTKEDVSNGAVARIEKCPTPVLISWMHDEAEWLVAQVLAQRQWAWAEPCLEKIRTDKKERLLKMRREIRPLPKPLAARLLTRLADSLEDKAVNLDEIALVDDVDHQRQGRAHKVRKWLRSFVQRA